MKQLRLFISLFLLAPSLSNANDEFSDNPLLKTAAIGAYGKMAIENVRRQIVDDLISQRTFKLFLERLDPRKTRFHEEDVKGFTPYETLIDDQIKDGNLASASII